MSDIAERARVVAQAIQAGDDRALSFVRRLDASGDLVAHEFLHLVVQYSPSQPRDDHGRFSREGFDGHGVYHGQHASHHEAALFHERMAAEHGDRAKAALARGDQKAFRKEHRLESRHWTERKRHLFNEQPFPTVGRRERDTTLHGSSHPAELGDVQRYQDHFSTEKGTGPSSYWAGEWEKSSKSGPSTALRQATAEKFGFDTASFDAYTAPYRHGDEEHWRSAVDNARVFVDDQYAKTQRWYHDHPDMSIERDGTRYVPVTRGLFLGDHETHAPQWEKIKQETRGKGYSFGAVRDEQTKLASWTSDPAIASQFALNHFKTGSWHEQPGTMLLLSTYVPVENILGNSLTGIGYHEQSEHVLVGGDMHIHYMAKRTE